MEWVQSVDRDVAVYVNGFVGLRPAIDEVLGGVSRNPLLKGAVYVAFLWWAWFAARPGAARESNRHFVIRSILGGLIAAAVGRLLQQALPLRSRPLHDVTLALESPVGTDPAEVLSGWSSFPSDHAVLFFALSTAVWLWSRPLGVLAFAWATVVVCLPRLYLGLHYPSDLIGGALFGIAVMLAVHRLPWPAGVMEVPCRLARRHPSLFYAGMFLATFELATIFQNVRHIGGGVARLLAFQF